MVLFPVAFFSRTPWAASLPPFPLCVRAPSRVLLSLLFFFLPSSLHTRTSPLHSSSGYGSPLFLSLVLSPPRGVPLSGSRPRQVGAPPSRYPPVHPLSSPLSALPPSPVPRPSPYCCSPARCALCCTSPRQGCILRALTRLSACALSSVLLADLGGLPRYPLGGILPSSAPAGLPSITSLMVGRGSWYGSMWVICLALLCVPCGAPVCCCSPPVSLPHRAATPLVCTCIFPFFPLVSHLSPLRRALRVSPAHLFSTLALPPLPLSPCHVCSPLPTTSPRTHSSSHGGASLAQPRPNVTVRYHPLCCTSSRVVHSRVSLMPYPDVPTLPPGVRLYPKDSSAGPPMWVCVVWHDFAVWPTEPPVKLIPGRHWPRPQSAGYPCALRHLRCTITLVS